MTWTRVSSRNYCTHTTKCDFQQIRCLLIVKCKDTCSLLPRTTEKNRSVPSHTSDVTRFQITSSRTSADFFSSRIAMNHAFWMTSNRKSLTFCTVKCNVISLIRFLVRFLSFRRVGCFFHFQSFMQLNCSWIVISSIHVGFEFLN